ncbi:MAG: hypothetical protein PHF00_05775 [Elusimicrobia bacterium]|nr:hypothetical protein [Elusimicrobiota bacterium]
MAILREERHELLDSKIRFHDRHRFEIKLDVSLPEAARGVYRVETYFFIPRALNVNPATYTKADFYNGTQQYIRFKTPQLDLGKLLDASLEGSPLSRVARNASELLAGKRGGGLESRTVEEIKLLGCMARGAMRDYVKQLLDELALAGESNEARLAAAAASSLAFLADVRALTGRVRALRPDLTHPAMPQRLRDAFAFLDEFLSLNAEEYLAELLEGVRARPGARAALAAVDAALAALLLEQPAHRRAMGYPSVVRDSGRNETIVYRRSVLKKFISSVLYLNIQVSEWEGFMQFLFGLAAGIAMLFAVTAAIFAQSRYAVNSLPFVAVVVASYVFKDRVKDWLKMLFSRGITRWLADRKVRILDPLHGGQIGSFKEAFSFLGGGSVPPDISHRRNIDNITSVDEEGKPERVFKHEKEVTLFTGRIASRHSRLRDLNDIMRFSIREFARYADDPEIDYLHLDARTGELNARRCARVYHVNMVVKYLGRDAGGRQRTAYERVRIVLDQRGIVRLEEVPV